jgi:uncharacterized membrane protein YbaN (DUF454 family)
MRKLLKNTLLIILGWFFVFLGIIGAFLPLLPTTPFLILATILFANSSPRFHQMLLNNRYFGPGLRQWERERTVTRETKHRATLLIVLTFAVSIALVYPRVELQLMLIGIALVLLFFIWRLREPESRSHSTQQE